MGIAMIHPRYIPAPPAPVQTRPTIMTLMPGVAPQRALAAANIDGLPMKSHFVSIMPYALPRGRKDRRDGAEREADAKPPYLHDIAKGVRDRCLNISCDSGVEAVEEVRG